MNHNCVHPIILFYISLYSPKSDNEHGVFERSNMWQLNKLVIALENKKNSYTCMLFRVCFLSKNQYENLKRKCIFFFGGGGCYSIGLHRPRFC